jgi:NAD(P)-dependent dehydrogenase (short-subunit alcohol dehydrogenase family)
MDLNLKGKVAAVTGGAGGMGYAIAAKFLEEGCRVAVCDINEESLNNTVALTKETGKELYAEKVDVTKKADICRFIDNIVRHYGKLDIWCNNAGIVVKKAIIDMEEEEWVRVINVNLNAFFLGTQAAARAMVKADTKGVIINTASVNALMPTCYKSSYAASKAAVVSLTMSTAAELAPNGIRCNAIMPSFTETPMMAQRLKEDKDGQLLENFPLKRIAKPEEVADMVAFLASERAGFLTGAAYMITGGQLCVQDPMTAWGEGWTGLI